MGGRGSSAVRGTSSLSSEELNAVSTYVNMSNNINDLSPDKAEILEKAINRAGDVSGKVELYRSMSVKELGYNSIREIRENPSALEGKEFSTKGFMSTAKTTEGTGGLYAPRTVLVKFTNSEVKGLDISKVSPKAHEQEVLFPRNSTAYRITSSKALYDKEGDFMNLEITAKIIKRRKGN